MKRKRLRRSIKAGNLHNLQSILRENYHLINTVIDEQGNTPLLLAAEKNQSDIISYLLKLGANIHYKNNLGLSCYDYISSNRNIEMVAQFPKYLEIDLAAQRSIKISCQKLCRLSKKYSYISEKNSLLEIIISTLNKLNINPINVYQKLELSAVLNSLSHIIETTPEVDFHEELCAFLKTRETAILNTSLDYPNSNYIGNQICYAIAAHLYKRKNSSPYNLLLSQSLKKGHGWFNPIMSDANLPENAGDFIRDEQDNIHLYEIMADRAITELRSGNVQLADIWFGTDTKNVSKKMSSVGELPGDPLPLSMSTLNLLAQRTPTLGKLVAYTVKLDAYYKMKDISQDCYQQLANLRQGLLAGDVNNEGEEMSAGAKANIAIARFATWWNQLPSNLQQQIRSLSQYPQNDTNESIGDVLDIILDSENADKRNGIRYCIQLKGGMLDRIINDAYVKQSFNEISQNAFENYEEHKISDEKLKQWQEVIKQELTCPAPEIINEQPLLDILSLNTFAKSLIEANQFDYNTFAILQQSTLQRKPPLFIAAQQGHSDVVKQLLTYGADINAAIASGATSLFIAAQNGHSDVVEQLLTYGADINAARTMDTTPLHIAAQNGHSHVVEQLLTHGADINAARTDGTTPLFLAAQNGHSHVVEQLLAHEANINATSTRGATPLCIAAQQGHSDVVEQLLTHGANINAAIACGATPLYMAAQNGHSDVVKQLLTHGADINHARSYGLFALKRITPLQIAKENGHTEIVNAILKAKVTYYINKVNLRADDHYKKSFSLFGHQFNFGFSAGQKKAAAASLQCFIDNPDDDLSPHKGALTNGELGKIYRGFQ